jgi:hypothetical protein
MTLAIYTDAVQRKGDTMHLRPSLLLAAILAAVLAFPFSSTRAAAAAH